MITIIRYCGIFTATHFTLLNEIDRPIPSCWQPILALGKLTPRRFPWGVGSEAFIISAICNFWS